MRSAFLLPALAVGLALSVPAKVAPAATPARPAARTTAAKPVLPWIEDDWTKAVATAKARKLPIFVESWAPW